MIRSRLAAVLTGLVLLGGSGGAVALSSLDLPNVSGGAASKQYQPGKGCGDKNHTHPRDDCK